MSSSTVGSEAAAEPYVPSSPKAGDVSGEAAAVTTAPLTSSVTLSADASLTIFDARSASDGLGGESRPTVRLGVWGCGHGELDRIYSIVDEINAKSDKKIDAIICCGDFQCVRNKTDLQALSCPPKYKEMHTFHEYYSGAKTAPVLTIFVGGNHEASNFLQELPYGGWVAPNIWYMGTSGIVNVKGLRIAGISGIYKRHHYHSGYYEYPPYDDDSLRSVYHMREFDVWRMMHVREPIDVMITHDWPSGIHAFGDVEGLLRRKRHFREEVYTNTLGNPETPQLLHSLQPRYWFSAHLHVKFAAVVPHDGGACTRFLALDKCLPGREFFQVLDIPQRSTATSLSSSQSVCTHQSFNYDVEWLGIVKATHRLLPTSKRYRPLPPPLPLSRDQITAFAERIFTTSSEAECGYCCNKDTRVPATFMATALPHVYEPPGQRLFGLLPNPQTDALLSLLGLEHLHTVSSSASATVPILINDCAAAGPVDEQCEAIQPAAAQPAADPAEISLDDI